jgi:hypothetical protein
MGIGCWQVGSLPPRPSQSSRRKVLQDNALCRRVSGWFMADNLRVGWVRYGLESVRGQDSNLRPQGYERRELAGGLHPGIYEARRAWGGRFFLGGVAGGPGEKGGLGRDGSRIGRTRRFAASGLFRLWGRRFQRGGPVSVYHRGSPTGRSCLTDRVPPKKFPTSLASRPCPS